MADTFMKQQITNKVKWLEVESTQGTEFVPQELVSDVADCDEENVENMLIWFNKVHRYTDGVPFDECE